LITQFQNPNIVELGIDYGYSTFVFVNALMNNLSTGKFYGIDLFQGDKHDGVRDTYQEVMGKIGLNKLTNIEIIKGEFTEQSKKCQMSIDILHIDGLHTYEADVKYGLYNPYSDHFIVFLL
jgi:predicted O-methyltransferase YrrM